MKWGIANSNHYITIIDSKSTYIWYTGNRFEDTLNSLLIQGLQVTVWHLSAYICLSLRICTCLACSSQRHTVHLCHSTIKPNSQGDDQRYQINTILTNFDSQNPHTLANYSKRPQTLPNSSHCTWGSPNLKYRCHLIIKANFMVGRTVYNRFGPFTIGCSLL